MPRRRGLTFRAYARRRWRAVGLIAVAMAATLLSLTILDKGHEPEWRHLPGSVSEVTPSPDGRTLFALREDGDRAFAVVGIDASSGAELWSRDVNLTVPATVAAGTDWFAVATPFPDARLLAFHARGGNLLHDEFLGAEPRSVAAEGDRLAVALRSGTVLVYDDFQPTASLVVSPLVSALDVAGGRVAAATARGHLAVFSDDGVVVNTTRPVQFQSLRLSADGTHAVAAGRVLTEGDVSGVLEYFDLDAESPDVPQWSAPLRARVSLASISDDGRFVLGVQETSTRYTVSYWDALEGPTPLWAAEVDGAIYRNDAGTNGGAALSPDGRFVAYATDLGGDIIVVEGSPARYLWTYDTEGVTSLAFTNGGDGTHFAAGARLAPNRPYDAVLFFDVDSEPVWWRYPWFALGLVAFEALLGLAGLLGAYVWYRRQ